jgi:hypothetical protein
MLRLQNHAVTIVGWTTIGGQQCWIIQVIKKKECKNPLSSFVYSRLAEFMGLQLGRQWTVLRGV